MAEALAILFMDIQLTLSPVNCFEHFRLCFLKNINPLTASGFSLKRVSEALRLADELERLSEGR